MRGAKPVSKCCRRPSIIKVRDDKFKDMANTGPGGGGEGGPDDAANVAGSAVNVSNDARPDDWVMEPKRAQNANVYPAGGGQRMDSSEHAKPPEAAKGGLDDKKSIY
jgi:hypothetical protein